MTNFFRLCLIIVVIYSTPAVADEFECGVQYQVCFSPYQHCASQIIQLINHAKHDIFIQAYSFTLKKMAKALVKAKRRGVTVNVIFDKSNFDGSFHSSINYLIKNGILIWNDNLSNIAHNKVMIVDRAIVETGSFNYTVSAEKYNVENVLIIHSQGLAKQYLENWYRRARLSIPVR